MRYTNRLRKIDAVIKGLRLGPLENEPCKDLLSIVVYSNKSRTLIAKGKLKDLYIFNYSDSPTSALIFI